MVAYGKEPGPFERRKRGVIPNRRGQEQECGKVATIAMLTRSNKRDKLIAARSREIEFASSSPESPLPVGRSWFLRPARS
jgi:hypothetical protein